MKLLYYHTFQLLKKSQKCYFACEKWLIKPRNTFTKSYDFYTWFVGLSLSVWSKQTVLTIILGTAYELQLAAMDVDLMFTGKTTSWIIMFNMSLLMASRINLKGNNNIHDQDYLYDHSISLLFFVIYNYK